MAYRSFGRFGHPHQPAYAGHDDGTGLPMSNDLARRSQALPIRPDLGDVDVDVERVCDAMAATLG